MGFYGFYLFVLGAERLLIIPQKDKGTFLLISVFALAFMQILPFALAGAFSGIEVSYLNM